MNVHIIKNDNFVLCGQYISKVAYIEPNMIEKTKKKNQKICSICASKL